eukprot:TRINITY_DN47122_c0_g1_i1.p1 TRINITY_DN47122_c0_g1~~TRINITY_DN47122_c0_g1_i1.p1  ORF type:complete len:490 (-),score=104.84 TRINITY_DN47122_c0_g1_i1:210-1679(-)
MPSWRRLETNVPAPWAEVALSVYQLPGSSSLNTLTEAAGFGGAYHVGVEVYWLEWAYGYSHVGTGVVPCHIGTSSLGHFKERVPLGRTQLSPEEVLRLLAELRRTWRGADYDLLQRNCAHFAVELVLQLGVTEAPRWVYKLSQVGDQIVRALGVKGARAAADAATPAVREPPPMAALSEEDLEELVEQEDWEAALERRWREAQFHVRQLERQAQFARRFEELLVEMSYAKLAVCVDDLGGRSAELTEEMAEAMACDRDFRSLCLRAAARALGVTTKRTPASDYLGLVGLMQCPGQRFCLRLRLHSCEGAPEEWPPPKPARSAFEHRFLTHVLEAMTLGRCTSEHLGGWPQGFREVAASLHVLTAPGQGSFGERAETGTEQTAAAVPQILFADEPVRKSEHAVRPVWPTTAQGPAADLSPRVFPEPPMRPQAPQGRGLSPRLQRSDYRAVSPRSAGAVGYVPAGTGAADEAASAEARRRRRLERLAAIAH